MDNFRLLSKFHIYKVFVPSFYPWSLPWNDAVATSGNESATVSSSNLWYFIWILLCIYIKMDKIFRTRNIIQLTNFYQCAFDVRYPCPENQMVTVENRRKFFRKNLDLNATRFWQKTPSEISKNAEPSSILLVLLVKSFP